jgi:WD40 repeat protein
MIRQAQCHTGYLSRRHFLQGLGGILLTLSLESCTQTIPSSSGVKPTPTPNTFGKVLSTYRRHTNRVTTVGWSPNGTYIASGSLDKTVQVWAANSNSALQPYVYRGHNDGVTTVFWSPDSQRVASGSLDKTVQMWDALDGQNAIVARGHTDAVNAVAWSPDGKLVASGSADGTVRLWDAATGEQRFVYRGFTQAVNTVCWSPNSQQVVAGSMDTTVQVLNAATGARVLTYRGHSGNVSSVSWSPDGSRIVSGSWDKTAQVWDATTGQHVYTYAGYNVQAARTNDTVGVLPDLILIVAWSPSGKRIAAVTQLYCGDNCGVVVTWDAATERNYKFYIDFPVFALVWSPDDTRFATATEVTTQGTGPNANESDPQAGDYVQITRA